MSTAISRRRIRSYPHNQPTISGGPHRVGPSRQPGAKEEPRRPETGRKGAKEEPRPTRTHREGRNGGAAPPARGANQVDLSVVIVSWNVRDLLQTCLESLRPAWERTWAEVIVVDNASTDGTPDLVREHYPAVRLIANAANRGFGAANNQGMAAAGGRYL